jgi:hypothetical protein
MVPCALPDSEKIVFSQNNIYALAYQCKYINLPPSTQTAAIHSQQQLTPNHVPLTDGYVASFSRQPHLKLHIPPVKHHVCLYTTTCRQAHSLPLSGYSSTRYHMNHPHCPPQIGHLQIIRRGGERGMPLEYDTVSGCGLEGEHI